MKREGYGEKEFRDGRLIGRRVSEEIDRHCKDASGSMKKRRNDSWNLSSSSRVKRHPKN